MTGAGEDRARDMLGSALDLFNAHGSRMTPAEQALFSVGLAQAVAALSTRDMIRALTGNDPPGLRDDLREFTGAAGVLAEELKWFNDAHES